MRAASTMVAILALAGCTSAPIACERDNDCPAELACGGDGLCGSGPVTRLFVISRLAIPGTDGTHARGFDLDGVVSDGTGTGCVERARDYVSLDDPAVRGVDNWMATMLPTIAESICTEGEPEACVEELIASSIAEGSTLIAIELADLDSYRDDPEIVLLFHRARIPGCSGSCAPALDGDVLAVDQRFQLELIAEGSGAIEDGALRATFEGPLAIDVWADTVNLGLPLRDGRLEATLDAAGLHEAVLGGGFALDDLPFPPTCDPGACEPIAHPLGSQADLDPDPADPTTCRRLSVALTFSAIPALTR